MCDNTEKKSLADHPEIYTFLTNYYLYQDGLSWGRTQLLVAVEAGAIASAFAVRPLAWITLTMGAVLVFILWLIVERDWQTRDQYNHLLDKVHKPFEICMIQKPRYKWWRGSLLLRIVFIGFILLDIILAALFLFINHWYCKALLDVFRYK